MKKNFTAACVVALSLGLADVQITQAQSPTSKLELGGKITVLRQDKPRTFPSEGDDGRWDVGAVLEYYPPRSLLRFDAGDTIVHFGNTTRFPFSPEFPNAPVVTKGGTVHNFQLSVGIGFRF